MPGCCPTPPVPLCVHCKVNPAPKNSHNRRGLCRRCTDDPEVRALYRDDGREGDGGRPCRNCPSPEGSYRRGLCRKCYEDPQVRARFPGREAGAYYGNQHSRRRDPVAAGVPLPEPTRALPGSEAKILVLMQRARKRQALHHPDDAKGEADRPVDLSGFGAVAARDLEPLEAPRGRARFNGGRDAADARYNEGAFWS